MAFTRFNYDDCRTKKKLQESTGPGRYVMNTPGSGNNPLFIDDPHIRMQKWGANNRYVFNGSLIDIDNDLRNFLKFLKNEYHIFHIHYLEKNLGLGLALRYGLSKCNNKL